MGYVQWAEADNGDIPVWKMVDVDGQKHLLNPSAAAFFHAWDDDFYNLTGTHITISEAFRDIKRQEYLYDGWNRRLAGFFMAAVPHTSSHGMAVAVDVNSWVYGSDEHKHDLLVESGLRHGWSWYTVGKPSGEPWHFNYTGDLTSISVQDYNNRFGEVDPLASITLDDIRNVVKNEVWSAMRDANFVSQVQAGAFAALSQAYQNAAINEAVGKPVDVSIVDLVASTRAAQLKGK